MIDAADIERKTARLLRLAREQYGVKADTLDKAMHKIGRRVPKHVHDQARVISEAQRLGGHPKLMLQVDADKVEAAFDEIQRAFKAEDRADRRKGTILSTLGSLSFNLIAVAVLLILFLKWQGFL